MTNDDIKKAIMSCDGIDSLCDECPYNSVRDCDVALKIDARNLITEQEQKIEKLKAENEQLEEDIDMIIKEQKGDYEFDIIQAKIDVLNDLKEKIQNAIDTYYNSQGGSYYSAEDVISDIDQMIEEVEK